MTMPDPGVQAQGDARDPFVYKCSTKSHKYLFDVNTSRMLCVPPAVWDIVEDVGVLALPDLIAKYAATYPASAISEAHDAILAIREKGLLSDNRPREIAVPYEEEEIRDLLATHRESLTLVVTEQCNFRCSYCIYSGEYAHRRAHSPAMMSWDVARLAIDEYLAHSGQRASRGLDVPSGTGTLSSKM